VESHQKTLQLNYVRSVWYFPMLWACGFQAPFVLIMCVAQVMPSILVGIRWTHICFARRAPHMSLNFIGFASFSQGVSLRTYLCFICFTSILKRVSLRISLNFGICIVLVRGTLKNYDDVAKMYIHFARRSHYNFSGFHLICIVLARDTTHDLSGTFTSILQG